MKLNLAFVAYLMVCATSVNAEPHDVFGTYLTEDRNSHVQISDCGDGRPCGTIVWVAPETLAPGETPESLRSKSGEPIIGLQILHDFKRNKAGWHAGTIYAPDRDKTYRSKVRKLENGNLEVKGCISFLCQSQIWTPVSSTKD